MRRVEDQWGRDTCGKYFNCYDCDHRNHVEVRRRCFQHFADLLRDEFLRQDT